MARKKKLTLALWKRYLDRQQGYTRERKGLAFDAMAKLLCWCQDNDVRVVEVPGRGGCFQPPTKTVELGLKRSPDWVLSTMLHECGHAMCVGEGPFKNVRSSCDPLNGKADVVLIIEEELCAWRCAERLRDALGVLVAPALFSRLRTQSLFSYVRYANKQGTKRRRRGKVRA